MDQQITPIRTGHDMAVAAKRGWPETGRDDEYIFTLVRVFINLARLGTDEAKLFILFEKIDEQAILHFRDEEERLKQLSHPSRATQREDHCRIQGDLAIFRDRVLSGQAVSTSEYMHVFDSLIIHHVREEQMYGQHQINMLRVAELVNWQ